ncbi:MAG: M15 family metallopeptidase [Rhodoferax sp.]
MSLVNEQAAFLLDVLKLVQFATGEGFVVTGGELFRPPEMQEIYVKTGRSKTMNSRHLQRCAIDFNFFVQRNEKLELTYDVQVLKKVGDYWESLNPLNSWGGNWNTFKDVPHFERRV